MIVFFLYVCLGLLVLAPVAYSKVFFRTFINPIAITTVLTLPLKFFIYGGPIVSGSLLTNGLRLALLVEVTYILIQTIVILLIINSRQGHILDRMMLARRSISHQNFVITALVFFILFILTFLILANKTVGIIEWLRDPRFAYINYRRGNGVLYALSVNFLCLSAYFSMFNSRTFLLLTSKFIFFTTLLMFFGSKGGVVAMIIFFFIVQSLLFGIRVKRYIILLPILLVFVIFIVLQSGLNDLDRFIRYFDYFTNAQMYYDDYLSGRMPLFGGKILFTNYWGMVPRSLVEDKPIVYGILYIVENYYPGVPASGNTPAFGARVYEFSDFGLLGVILHALFDPLNISHALILVAIFKNKYAAFDYKNLNMLIGFAVLFGPQFGVFFNGIVFLIFIILVAFVSKIATKFKY